MKDEGVRDGTTHPSAGPPRDAVVADAAAGETPWHAHTVAEAGARLASGASGLSAGEVARRRAEHGPNVLTEAPRRSPLATFAAQFADVMILVLIAAAIVSGFVGEVADTLAILAIVLLNGTLGYLQERRAERAFEALRALSAPTATVVREGGVATIPAAELVPGDAVVLDAGRIVPADLRLIEAASLRVDEAALTGESEHVDKYTDAVPGHDVPLGDRRNIAYRGTAVTYGRGVGLVIATGMRTEFGRIARLLAESHSGLTPLQRRLDAFGRRLALVVLAICAIVLVGGLLRGEPALASFMTALSLAVAAIPEALPAVVTIALALGARRMALRHALIRRLPAVETLGSVTFVCSDKTGTLTTNAMRVERLLCDGEERGTPGTSAPWQVLVRAMAVSHDVRADAAGVPVGDATEVALVLAARGAGLDERDAIAREPRVGEVPFDSQRKRMTTVHSAPGGTWWSVTKGAAEVVLERCTLELRTSGAVPIDREPLRRAADAMAADGLRVLAIAVRAHDCLPLEFAPDELESALTFVALVGLIDPPRPEARAAIDSCVEAGIVPVMITGDHPATARAIARRLGLLPAAAAADPDAPDPRVLTGRDLAALDDAALAARAPDVRVYARVAPEQKVRIVAALQARGEIVAMTGDGVNDAPALRRADIGVAMGVSGTDVAREAGAMVLLDDHFATIVSAIREGRRIYDNLRRFVRYVLTTNSAEIWTIFLAPFLGLPVPLLPIQILWINLVTDGFPGLALAAEPAERDVMRRRPRAPAESLFARGLGMHAFLVGLTMAGLALALQAWHVGDGGAHWQTAVFTALCFMQLAHALAIRSETESLFTLGLGTNRPLLLAVLATVVLQLAVVYAPPLNAIFRTVPLAPADLATCFACALAVFAIVELEKAWRRRTPPVVP